MLEKNEKVQLTFIVNSVDAGFLLCLYDLLNPEKEWIDHVHPAMVEILFDVFVDATANYVECTEGAGETVSGGFKLFSEIFHKIEKRDAIFALLKEEKS